MRSHGVSAKLLARLLPLDLFLSVMMTTAWLATVGMRELGPSVALVSVVCGARIVVWVVQLERLLRPLRGMGAPLAALGDAAILAATLTVDNLPTRFTVRYCVGWLSYILCVVALAWFVFPELLTLGRTELVGIGAQSLTAVLGPWMLAYPFVHRVVQPTRLELVAELQRRGIPRRRATSSLVFVVTGMVAGLILAPSSWLAAQVLITAGDSARQQTLLEGRYAARWAAHELAEHPGGDAPVEAAVEAGLAILSALPPELASAHEREPDTQLVELVDHRHERVSAAAAVGDGRWVVFTAPVEHQPTSQWLGLISCGLAILLWALLAIQTTRRSLVEPMARLRDRLRLATKVAAGPASLRLPVARSDELGELVTTFNEFLDELGDIAEAADKVARGDLRVELSGDDHMRVVFRGMVDRLSDMVSPVRAAAAAVAAAAADIDASTRSQDLASQQQAEASTEVQRAMQRLAESTVAISGAANEVLANAEQTRARADVVVERTLALSESIAQIGRLLEQIHDVADRSDLLALNGSLEATRAGEAGRGFTLIAAEMRRLAERVNDTVAAVRRALAEVGSSHAATAEATLESRELAEHTTAAARRIFAASREQSEDTELVSSAVRGVAETIEASETAVGRTRLAADGLRAQARELEQLLEHFEVRDQRRS